MRLTIYLAAGCFWGTQAYFDLQEGVIKTEVGYANGNQNHVSYEEVCQGNTNFVETCKVTFDPAKITLATLLTKYWGVIDPTLVNKQGNDVGTQYRTGIYYDKSFPVDQIKIIETSKAQIAKHYQKPVVTEILPLKNFVVAEREHQNYLAKHPDGYCHIDLSK